MNIDNPQTFNEKLNWSKLNDRNPLYTQLADKYEVKRYVASIIGEEFVVKNYGVWNRFDDINFDDLPSSFVLKATHDSGGAIICKNKEDFDFENAKKRLTKALRTNYYWPKREWVYKNMQPRIIADQYLDDGSGHELRDYKFWCFDGQPRLIYCTNKAKDIFENFYDMDFNPININHGFRRNIPEFVKPASFETMKELAAKLSKGIPFVRVDFFFVNGHVYFGEFTFYDWAGLRPFTDHSWDMMLGDYIKLPKRIQK